MTNNIILYLALVTTSLISVSSAASNFSILNSCTCPEITASYECQVVGDGFTVWRGTAFDCRLSDNELVLSHTNFDVGIVRTCNSGSIVGRSLSVTNGHYTSRLDVNITTELDGRTVVCGYENGVSPMMIIGSKMISLTRDPYNTPNNISLKVVNPNMLTFNWNSVAENCSTLRYDITSNCGDCPTTTNKTYVSCTLNRLSVDIRCYFSVRSVVCGDIASNWSSLIYATIKVPDAPIITSVVAKYGSDDMKKLINLDIKWTEVASFNIFEKVSGSPQYYTAIFFNTSMGRSSVCGSVSINTSHCLEGVCTSSLSSPCYQLGGNITASVSVTNILGEGPRSTIYNIATTNQYVEVTFESASRVICKFLGPVVEGERSCTISYGPCQQRLTMTAEGSTSIESPTTVRIDIDTNLNTYCYSINASNGSFVWLIEGSYGNIMTSESPDTSSTVIIIIIILIMLIILVWFVLILILLILLFLRRKRSLQKQDIHNMPNRGYEYDSESGSNTVEHCDPPDPVDIDNNIMPNAVPNINQTQITAHVILELQDEPGELLKALECFKSETDSVNIKNINICDHASEKPQANLRTVYIECEDNLNDKEANTIEDRIKQNQHVFSVEVHMEAKEVQVPKDIDHDSRYVKEIIEVLEHMPDALSSLLEVINATEECKHINITDILVEPLTEEANNKYKQARVTIKFIPEMARDWKEKYDMKKNECQFIVPTTEGKTLSLSMSTPL